MNKHIQIGRTAHMTIHVSLIRRLNDADLVTAFTPRASKPEITAKEIRDRLDAEERRGRVFWNECDTPNEDGSCGCEGLK